MDKKRLVSTILAHCRKHEKLNSMTDGLFEERRALAIKVKNSKVIKHCKNVQVNSVDGNLYITNGTKLLMRICMYHMLIIYQSEN